MVDVPEDDLAMLFFDRAHELCLFQHIAQATRACQNQNPSTLDYIFTDEDNIIESSEYEDPLGKSDHVVLTWELAVTTDTIPANQMKLNYHCDIRRSTGESAGHKGQLERCGLI